MSRGITRGRLAAAFAVLVVAALGVLPFLVFADPYGEVPIPGAATVHLPAGEVDATLRTAGPTGDVSVPPLSISISGPDGTPQPEVIESPRWKHVDAQSAVLVRVWVVRIVQEADYHIEIEGEVYCPYPSALTFGRNMWNEPLEVLIVLGGLLWFIPVWTAFFIFVLIAFLVLVSKLRKLCTKQWSRQASEP